MVNEDTYDDGVNGGDDSSLSRGEHTAVNTAQDDDYIVNAAWKEERIPNVKNKFSTRAPLATIPGMNPYIEHM